MEIKVTKKELNVAILVFLDVSRRYNIYNEFLTDLLELGRNPCFSGRFPPIMTIEKLFNKISFSVAILVFLDVSRRYIFAKGEKIDVTQSQSLFFWTFPADAMKTNEFLTSKKCRNPCFSGRFPPIILNEKRKYEKFYCRNPCFSGRFPPIVSLFCIQKHRNRRSQSLFFWTFPADIYLN